MIIDLIDINLPQCMVVAYWGVSNDNLPEGFDFITRERCFLCHHRYTTRMLCEESNIATVYFYLKIYEQYEV